MDRRKPTTQMLGRFQPWHEGHTQLFKRAYAKTGQVAIMVRDTGEGWFNEEDTATALKDAGYTRDRDYEIIHVPNIVNITYGRNVGYKIEQERLDEEIERISATNFRKVFSQ